MQGMSTVTAGPDHARRTGPEVTSQGSAAMQPEQFRIEFTDAAVADLRDRIGRTRWPGDYGNDEWKYGANQEWMQETLAYWRDEFDFAGFEAALNQWDHFRVV